MAIKNAVLEDVRIMFRNFSGKEDAYNRAGDRNFAVALDPAIADQMAKDGWNVKTLNPRDEDETPQAYIQVSVSYKNRPPRVMLVTDNGKTPLGEDEVDMLDYADLKTIDVILNPYEWAVNGKSGVKAYLDSGYFVLEENELDRKYA